MKVPAKCKECGSSWLTWDTHIRTRLGCPVQNGRLSTNEVECLFVLGCDDCSETLAIVSADKIAAYMTANHRSQQQ